MPYPPNEIMESIDSLTDRYDDLTEKRTALLVELDNISRKMDQLLLAIARLQDDDPSEAKQCEPTSKSS